MGKAEEEHVYQDGRFVILEADNPPHVFIVNSKTEDGEWFIPFSHVEFDDDRIRFGADMLDTGEPITLGGFRFDEEKQIHDVLPPMMLRRLKLIRENDE